MLDTGDDDFNKEMQHVGSAVGVAPMAQSLLAAHTVQVAWFRLGITFMRMNPFLAPFVQTNKR